MQDKQKILVILGQTATGKSALAVKLAVKLNGEIISADSRQVYRGLDIGSGKITREEMRGIRHHLLDVADPDVRFSVVQWRQLAAQTVDDILSRGKLPIICGGTGFYISALVDDLQFPRVGIGPEEQAALGMRPPGELAAELKKLDPRRAAEIDPHNRRRLARAILIARHLGSVPPLKKRSDSAYDAFFIGLSLPDALLKERIRYRLSLRIEGGLIEEVIGLHQKGLSFYRMRELGLEYRFVASYLKKELTMKDLTEVLSAKIWQYARRQKTWFKKDKRIHWHAPEDFEKICTEVSHFLLKRELWQKD